MTRLWPKSLLGQMLISVAIALLIAQSISAALLWRASENRREEAVLNAAAVQLIIGPRDQTSREVSRGANQRRTPELRGSNGPPRRGLRLEVTVEDPRLQGDRPDAALETRLREVLQTQNVLPANILVTQRLALSDPFIRERPRLVRRLDIRGGQSSKILVAAIQMSEGGDWQVARVPLQRARGNALRTIVLQTLFIFAILMGLHFLLLRRITRPLAMLTRRTELFGQGAAPTAPLAAEGPDDIRQLVDAHNAMESRIAALLDEKDIMLGAIGHDLKTPLAALRVRIEGVDDPAERGKMAESIEDITRSLDDILTLAKVGRTGAPPEKAQLAALVSSVVEEFEDMGKDVTVFSLDRIAYPVHLTWLKRAIRNLISNAVRYAGRAEVSLLAQDHVTIIRIEDSGPGIPADQIAGMLEPFTRGETSRNRDTGGAGLGLTLARAIAEQHGGKLILSNRTGGGLRAEIQLPPTNV